MEKKERVFKIKSLFNTSRSEILMEIKEYACGCPPATQAKMQEQEEQIVCLA